MKAEDIKPGMRVIYMKGTECEDTGTVPAIGAIHESTVDVRWDSDGLVSFCNSCNLEPLEASDRLQAGSFTINPGKTIQKVVEVQEPETYTITLSRRAVQELRAVVGAAYCSGDKAIFKETQELRDMLWGTEDKLYLEKCFNMKFE